MRSTDRNIIAAAIFGIILSLGAASLLVRPINAQRVELQFTANEDITKNLPPEYAIPYIALGAFRGPVLNFLWIRLEDMKQDGKFWEAKQLSEVITRLQPRFPHVWANRAWNLSYNISVATHTARERWFWVRAGIDLLRDEGIPQNPNSILLYKELSWIFLHKIGMFSDDLHRYYKAKLAEEWHYFLGDPLAGRAEAYDFEGKAILGPDGQPLREWAAITGFRPIAWMYDKYINTVNLPWRARLHIRSLLDDPRLKERVEPFAELPALRMRVRAQRLQDKLRKDAPDLAGRLQPLIDELAKLEARYGEPLDRFVAGEPDCAPLVTQLAAMGLKPDVQLMERVGRMRAAIAANAPEAKTAHEKLREMFGDPDLDALENRDKPAARLLAYMRAYTLDRKYNMDPLWMLELMEGRWFVHPDTLPELEREKRIPAIPVDWRHPAAHGMYWAALGVRKSQGILKPQDFDLLNTDRQILHGLQALMHSGKLLYDPFSGPDGGYHRMIPDVRFIDAYHYAVFGSVIRNPAERLKGAAVVESFEAGHENFLTWATQELYLAGQDEQADRYYRLLRQTFTDRDPRNLERYRKPLHKFVMDEFIHAEEIEDDDRVRGMLVNFLMRAIDEGLAANNPQAARRWIDSADTVYKNYHRSQGYRTLVGPDGINRMAMPPFPDMFAQALEVYLTRVLGPGAIRFKIRAWENVHEEYQRRVYDRVRPVLVRECREIGLDPDSAFPEPPGMEEYRQNRGRPLRPESPDQPFVSERRSGMR
jgi:hypothetical protein